LVEQGSLAAARRTWAGRAAGGRGEGDDAWWRLALRGVDEPLDPRFAELAQAIYGPMQRAFAELAT
jgi:exodeoxyribonuclease V gamma subunit